MGSQLPTNKIDEVLAPVLMRHPGFSLEQSSLIDSVWSGRIRRGRELQKFRMNELEIALRDALYSSQLQLRSARISPDFIELQVTAPDANPPQGFCL